MKLSPFLEKSQPPLFPANVLEVQQVGRLCWAFGDDKGRVCCPWAFPSQQSLFMVLVEVSTALTVESLLLAMIFS